MQCVFVTIELTVMSIVLALALAMVLALMGKSDNPDLRWLSGGYVSLFRAIPQLVLIILVFNAALLYPTVSIGIPFGPQLWSVPTNSLITAYFAAVIAFGCYQASYTSEAIRAALSAVPPGQREAAKALGMSPTLTFWRIVVPQAFRIAIPSLGNEAIHLLKGTTLVAFISVNDLLYNVQTIYHRTFEVIPLLMVACVWYMLMVAVMSAVQKYLERITGASSLPSAGREAAAPAMTGPAL
jgi:polar amino acid transport system permease protein